MTGTLRERLIALIEPVLVGWAMSSWSSSSPPGRRTRWCASSSMGRPGWVWRTASAVSREVSALLDVEDPIPTAYTLEVSSPGV